MPACVLLLRSLRHPMLWWWKPGTTLLWIMCVWDCPCNSSSASQWPLCCRCYSHSKGTKKNFIPRLVCFDATMWLIRMRYRLFYPSSPFFCPLEEEGITKWLLSVVSYRSCEVWYSSCFGCVCKGNYSTGNPVSWFFLINFSAK